MRPPVGKVAVIKNNMIMRTASIISSILSAVRLADGIFFRGTKTFFNSFNEELNFSLVKGMILWKVFIGISKSNEQG